MNQMGTPIASDDALVIDLSVLGGDIGLNVLANDDVILMDGTIEDYAGDVLEVEGEESDAGAWSVQGSNGGIFNVLKDGTLVFDVSTIDFNDTTLTLNDDGSLTTQITYKIGTYSTDEVCIEVPFMPPSTMLTEDVWFGSVISGPCIDGATDGVSDIEWDYHKGEDKLTFKLKFDDKALFGDNNDDRVVSADTSGIERTMTELGAHKIEINKLNFTDSGVEIEIKGYGIVFDGVPDNDDAIEEYMNQTFGREILIPLVIEEDGEPRQLNQLFCIEKFHSHSPIAFDLNGDGKITTTGVSTAQFRIDQQVGDTVQFDIDADGDVDEIEWMAAAADGSFDGLLFDGSLGSFGTDGVATGANLFGDEGGKYGNGYEKLALRDADGNGEADGEDGEISGAELAGLEMWVDTNGNARVDSGELHSLDIYGIQSISVEYREVLNERGEVLIQATAGIGGGSALSGSSTELAVCENAIVCFDFQTTAELLTEDVWFGSVISGPCIGGDTDGVGEIKWDYHKGDDKLTFKLKIDDDVALFGDDSEISEVVGADMSGIEKILTDLGATSIEYNKFKFTDKNLEIEVRGYGIDFLNGSGDDKLIEQYMNQLLGDDVLVPLHVEIDGEPDVIQQLFCIEKFDSHSPVALDLNGDGKIGTTGVSTAQQRIDAQIGSTVVFDIDADGQDEVIEWMNTDGDGLLFDASQGDFLTDGVATGANLFGDQGGVAAGGWANGYAKLAARDGDGDGVADGADGQISGMELTGLQIWVDRNADAVVDAGELESLADYGIQSIATGFDRVLNDRGEVLMQSSATVDAEASGLVSYRILGTDAHLFSIDADTGELSFITPADYENPLDSNGDNVYDLVVERTIGRDTWTENVSITVKDCDDEATVTVTVLPPQPPMPSSISGRYFEDFDGNGYESAGDVGREEATVWLEEFVNNTWQSTGKSVQTSAEAGMKGDYAFEDLDAGIYRVVFEAVPVGADFLFPNFGTVPKDGDPGDAWRDDSDVIATLTGGRGATGQIVLNAGQDIADIDAGYADVIPDTEEGSVDAVNDTYLADLVDFDEVDADGDGTFDYYSFAFGNGGGTADVASNGVDTDGDGDIDAWSYLGTGESILFNDSDPNNDLFSITDVDQTGLDVGEVFVAADGSFEFRLSISEAIGIAASAGNGGPTTVMTSFEYEITDNSATAETDVAQVTILIDTLDFDG